MDYIKTQVKQIMDAAHSIPIATFGEHWKFDDWMVDVRAACYDCDITRIKTLINTADKAAEDFLSQDGGEPAYIRTSGIIYTMSQLHAHIVNYAESKAYISLMKFVDENYRDTKMSIRLFSIAGQISKRKYSEGLKRINNMLEKDYAAKNIALPINLTYARNMLQLIERE